MNRVVRVLFPLLFGYLALAVSIADAGRAQAAPQNGENAEATTTTDSSAPTRSLWSPEVLEAIESLPVQDEGRIKPFLSFAKQKLTQISGRSTVATQDAAGETVKITAVAWMLDVLFRPEVTFDDRVFLVPSREILDAIELPHEGRKMRDRYSYNDLVPARRKLYELTDLYREKRQAKKNLPIVTGQIVTLGSNLYYYERLASSMRALRKDFTVDGAELQKLLGGDRVRASAITKKGVELNKRLAAELETTADDKATPLRRLVLAVLETRAREARELAIFPPADADEPDWLSPGPTLALALRGETQASEFASMLASLEKLADGPAAVSTSDVTSLVDSVRSRAVERDEFGAVPYELHLENFGYLHWVRGLFFLALVLVAFLWWRPQAKWYGRFVFGLCFASASLLTVMIVLRCMIRYHDPSTDILAPVTNLYETIPFITVVGAFVLLFVEYFSKQRIALTLAIVLGFGGSQLALGYEPLDGGDTLSPLQAVLISNFWLLTHVQCVTVGYAASLVAALLAHVWLIGRMVVHFRGVKAPSAVPFLRSTMRMCYGAVAFGLIFSTVGTILGGIWANYSWGRFWGWDPKENGALMICLWQIMMLHSRMGGFVRHFGFALLSIVLGMITAFSWWHVNQLGVGLHSYGFTDGILRSLWIFYGFESFVILTAVGARALASFGGARSATSKASVEPPSGGGAAVKAQDRLD